MAASALVVRRDYRVQRNRTRRRWLSRLRNPNAIRAASLISRLVPSVPALVMRVSTSRPNGHRRSAGTGSAPQSDPIASTLQALLRRVDRLETQLLNGHPEPTGLQMYSLGLWEDRTSPSNEAPPR